MREKDNEANWALLDSPDVVAAVAVIFPSGGNKSHLGLHEDR